MKSILTMAWTAEDPSAFDLAAKLARTFNARLVGLEPPSYGVMSMAWADAGIGVDLTAWANANFDSISKMIVLDAPDSACDLTITRLQHLDVTVVHSR